MGQIPKRAALILAVAILLFATGAYADSLNWTISGPNVTGSGTMSGINEGSGIYLITGMSGNIAIQEGSTTVGGAITGFTQFVGTWTPGAYSTISNGNPGWVYEYDDIVNLNSPTELDAYGLVFSLNGFANPFDMCSGTTGLCTTPSLQEWIFNDAASLSDQINFSARVATPESSTLQLLCTGFLALAALAACGKRLA